MSYADRNTGSVAIIGAGIIGLSCALALAERDVCVTLYETHWPPRGASWAAAGMLAPAFEAIGVENGHPDLFKLCDASMRVWPEWAAKIEQVSGLPSGYDPGPSLAVARTSEEAARLERLATTLSEYDFAPTLYKEDISALDASVTRDAVAALVLPSDGQADNRLTLTALMACIEANEKIKLHIGAAPLRRHRNGLDHAGHDATLLTAGWQSGTVCVQDGAQDLDIRTIDPVLNEIEPIGGQMLAVEAIAGGPKLTLRAGHVYIVPKSDRIVIGATSEPGRVLVQSEAEQIAQLRAQAIAICPVLEHAEILDSWVGVRPGLKNHAPLLGETRVPGLFVASGHYRNGILLAPITAQIIADLIVHGETTELAAAFQPDHRLTAKV